MNLDILDKIVAQKKKEVAVLKKKLKIPASIAPRAPRFLKTLQNAAGPVVIAEIKKRSPSKGLLRKDFNPIRIARKYEKAGARALSVLTDRKFFEGSVEILKKVRRVTDLPILRKDFIIDPAQIWESRLAGADAILLIAAILKPRELKRLHALAQKLGLDVLLEVHSEADVKRVLPLKPKWVGINNRDLQTFEVDLETTGRLAKRFGKDVFIVTESGIRTSEDFLYLLKCGADAALIGEHLMKKGGKAWSVLKSAASPA